jgi:long-chain acyl-CoA synthetase
MYAGKSSCFIESQLRFEDGRTDSVSADLRIEDVKTFSAAAARQAA